jgi:hypothetical protein
MAERRKSPLEISVEDLDRELIARGAQTPGDKQFRFKAGEGFSGRDAVMTGIKELYKTAPPRNEALADMDTIDLAKILKFKAEPAMDFTRLGQPEGPMDGDEIIDGPIKENAGCTAAIFMKDNFKDTGKGFSALKVTKYGDAFNLCDFELFREQPIAAGFMGTGFLVKEDVVAAAGHLADENNVTDLCFVFGYQMVDSSTPVTKFPNESIYRGVKILQAGYGAGKGDWALVKLDRKVVGQTIARLSEEKIFNDQAVYVIGHPLGLPMKYGGKVFAGDVLETYFRAGLHIYSGNSGAPVFDFETHEIIGMVVGDENRDFRWTGKGWMSFNPVDKYTTCTKVSDFIALVR